MITGNLTYLSGSSLLADRRRSALTVKSGAVTLQNRRLAVALGHTLPLPGTYKLVQADAGQTVWLRFDPGRRRRLRRSAYEKARPRGQGRRTRRDAGLQRGRASPRRRRTSARSAPPSTPPPMRPGPTGDGALTLRGRPDRAATGGAALDAAGRGGPRRRQCRRAAGRARASPPPLRARRAFGLTGTGPDACGVSHVLSYAAGPAEEGADCREGARRPRRRATGACGASSSAAAPISPPTTAGPRSTAPPTAASPASTT